MAQETNTPVVEAQDMSTTNKPRVVLFRSGRNEAKPLWTIEVGTGQFTGRGKNKAEITEVIQTQWALLDRGVTTPVTMAQLQAEVREGAKSVRVTYRNVAHLNANRKARSIQSLMREQYVRQGEPQYGFELGATISFEGDKRPMFLSLETFYQVLVGRTQTVSDTLPVVKAEPKLDMGEVAQIKSFGHRLSAAEIRELLGLDADASLAAGVAMLCFNLPLKADLTRPAHGHDYVAGVDVNGKTGKESKADMAAGIAIGLPNDAGRVVPCAFYSFDNIIRWVTGVETVYRMAVQDHPSRRVDRKYSAAALNALAGEIA